MLKQTDQERKDGTRQLLKLFGIWKLMVLQEEARSKTWVRPVIKEKRKLLEGASDNLVTEMEFDDREMFYNYCKMSAGMFDKLLSIVGPVIEKQCVVRDPIPARTRLLVCLRYLASEDSMASIASAFRIGTSLSQKSLLKSASNCGIDSPNPLSLR